MEIQPNGTLKREVNLVNGEVLYDEHCAFKEFQRKELKERVSVLGYEAAVVEADCEYA